MLAAVKVTTNRCLVSCLVSGPVSCSRDCCVPSLSPAAIMAGVSVWGFVVDDLSDRDLRLGIAETVKGTSKTESRTAATVSADWPGWLFSGSCKNIPRRPGPGCVDGGGGGGGGGGGT